MELENEKKSVVCRVLYRLHYRERSRGILSNRHQVTAVS